jgi:hypothetical protein
MNGGACRVAEWECGRALSLRRVNAFRAPHRYISGYALSPGGDRIAWVATPIIISANAGWMDKILARINFTRGVPMELWVSRIDGTGMHLVGSEPYMTDEDLLCDLQWLPDGKRITFTFRGSVFAVPAD